MKYLLVILFLLVVQNISSCSENQININTASINELDQLIGIGEAKAKAIVSERSFESVEDLTLVNGIGDATLEKIIEQGLACVNGISKKRDIEKQPEIETIKLNAKTFKYGEIDKIQEPNKNNYLIYGFIGFCFLLGFLFTIKKIKYRKNEFN